MDFASTLRVRLARPTFRGWALGLSLATLAASAQTPSDVRIALIIGNSAYALAPLANPANDARAMSSALSGLGFQVVELRDGSKEQMAAAIAQVRRQLQDRKGIGMLYYAGHGVQLDWHNYMVPVDAKMASASDVAQQAVDVGLVIDAFRSAGNRMNIMVLDACRDNPFAGTASGKGLAQIDAPPGTFLAFATSPGNVAEDGDAQGNGLYTRFLLDELRKPTAKIEDVFKRVRLQVRQASGGRQIPWESTSLEEDFYFNSGVKIVKPDEKAQLAAFEIEKRQWDRIKDTRDPADLFAFLQKYPGSALSESAQFRLDQLAKPVVVATVGKGQSASLGYTGERFRLGDEFTVAVSDTLTGVVSGRSVQRVTKVSDNAVEINQGTELLQPMGSVIQSASGKFYPPFSPFPAEFKLGKTWSSYSMQSDGSGPAEMLRAAHKITGRETITVPAGTFETWVVETRTVGNPMRPEGQQGGIRTYTIKSWIDPRYGIEIQRTERAENRWLIRKTEKRQLVSLKAERS